MGSSARPLPLPGPPRRLTVERDDGPIAATACAPHLLVTEDGEYVAKSDDWFEGPKPSWVMANEYICAALAQRLGLSIPSFALIEDDDETYVGLKRIPNAFPINDAGPSSLDRCRNRAELHVLAVFDIWLHNTDRHTGNLIVAGRENELRWWMIDHSHCPLFPGYPVGDFEQFHHRSVGLLVQPWLGDRVDRMPLLREAIDRVRSIPFEHIEAIVHQAPGVLWTDEETELVVTLIDERRNFIESLVRAQSPVLPVLAESSL